MANQFESNGIRYKMVQSNAKHTCVDPIRVGDDIMYYDESGALPRKATVLAIGDPVKEMHLHEYAYVLAFDDCVKVASSDWVMSMVEFEKEFE